MAIGALFEVILYVEDMAVEVGFYRDALDLAVSYPAQVTDFAQERWVTFATGACTLALHAGGRRRLGEDAPKIVFRVADVTTARADLVARGVAMGEVRSPAPGVTVCDGRDPEGNAFSIEAHGPAGHP